MNRRNNKGYTLYEVLLAITILGFVATPLIILFRTSVRTISKGKSNLQALFLAQYVMEKIKHDLATVPNYYKNLETDLPEVMAPLVENDADTLTFLAKKVKGYSSMAEAVANPEFDLAGGTIPPVTSKHFKDFEDIVIPKGSFEIGIEKKEEYKKLHKILSQYLVSVLVEEADFPVSDFDDPMKKITVTIHWVNEKGLAESLSLFAWEGPHVSSM